MISKVRTFLQQQNYDFTKSMVYVALSGGADSVCLFLLLLELQKEFGYTLGALHVEHGIRGEESVQDELFVRQLCAQNLVPCEVKKIDVLRFAKECGLGLEEAARKARYDFFEEKANGGFVALAHHREDNVETILFQMSRGSGLQGMCGMQSVREEDAVTYLRPLYDCSREEIEAFLTERKQPFCTDCTNTDVQYSRNAIRHRVIPNLRMINEKAVEHIHEGAKRLALVNDFLQQEAELAYAKVVQKTDKATIRINREQIFSFHPAIVQEVLLRALQECMGTRKDVGSVQVEQLLELSGKQSGKRVDLGKGIVARVEYGDLWLEKQKEKTEGYCIELTREQLETGGEIKLPGTDALLRFQVKEFHENPQDIPKKTYTKAFRYDMIKDSLQVRTRASGDYLIIDSQGHRKKLKSYFVEQKIPNSKRDDVWLIASQQEILWVIGGRISEAYKVGENTTRILEFTYIGGK